MAGIGFTLERMAGADDLTTVSSAYLGGALLVAGPWIFTALTIAAIPIVAPVPDVAVHDFRTILIYDFLASILLTSPIVLPATRFLSDEIYARRSASLQSALVVALALFAGLGALFVVPVFVATLPGAEAPAAVRTFFLLGATWILAPFVAALHRHGAVLAAFAAAMGTTLALSAALRPHDSVALLDVFTMGLIVALSVLVGQCMSAFGPAVKVEWRLLRVYAKFWELPLIGLCYGAGLWIDKVIMWISAPDGGATLSTGGFPTLPDYDSALFWAQLTAIPVMAVFFVTVEPGFYRLYRRFYQSFARKASLREVRDRQRRLGDFTLRSSLALLAAGGLIAVTAVLATYPAVASGHVQASFAGALRAALIGVAFQTGSMICLCYLLYFDLRRSALVLAVVGMVTNAGFTLAALPLGPSFYGYGYLASAIVTFISGFSLLARETPWLAFHAFVTTNDSAKPRGAAAIGATRRNRI